MLRRVHRIREQKFFIYTRQKIRSMIDNHPKEERPHATYVAVLERDTELGCFAQVRLSCSEFLTEFRMRSSNAGDALARASEEIRQHL